MEKPLQNGYTKIIFAVIGAILAWTAVVLQFYRIVTTATVSWPEITIRFFSYFTILTNTLVALYFTSRIVKGNARWQLFFQREGHLTAIAVYITVVGLVYQVVLRPLWHPQGLQQVVDEMLHSVNPVFFILYWCLAEEKQKVKVNQLPLWLIYPLVYLVFVMIRGYFSGFYPYPFIDVAQLGMTSVLLNSLGVTILFIGISLLYIFIARVWRGVPKSVSPIP